MDSPMSTVTPLLPLVSKNPRFRRAVELVALAQAGYTAYTAIREHFAKPDQSWLVTITSTDELFDVAVDLIADQVDANWRVVEARMSYGRGDLEDSPLPLRPTIAVQPSENEERDIVVDGHKVAVYLRGTDPDNSEGRRNIKRPEIVLSTSSEEGQRAVLKALTDAAERKYKEDSKKKPSLHVFSGFGHWARRGDLPARPVESVAVTDNQVEEIIADLKRFLDMEPEYVRRGIPYHRGYLLYGPPGTGKTSAAKAIAQAVGLDLYYASLGSVNADTGLSEIVSDVSARSVLLLEDIDSFAAARERSEDKATETGAAAGISTTGLLNVLDGVSTPHGQIVFMTTNHKEFLDPALLRPGRVDRQYYFGNPDDATVERHFAFFYDRKPLLPLRAGGRSGAEVNEVFVSNMFDPESAEAVLAEAPAEISRKES